MVNQNTKTQDDRLREFNNQVGLLATHSYVQSPQSITDTVNDATLGSTTQIKEDLQETFSKNVAGYVEETYSGVLLNNVENTNNFLYDTLREEMIRVSGLHDQLKNQIYKTRISILEKNYSIRLNRFRVKVLQATVLLVIISFVFLGFAETGVIARNMAIIFIGFLLIVFVTFLTVALRMNNKRRIDDWEKYYFSKPKAKSKK